MTNQEKFEQLIEHDKKIYIANAMERFGGGFSQLLGKLILKADKENLTKIYATWPELISTYTDIAKINYLE